jgi:hypothetical protein
MRGALPPLPQYAFMALCSVKAQGQLYLYFTLYPTSQQLNCLLLPLPKPMSSLGFIDLNR